MRRSRAIVIGIVGLVLVTAVAWLASRRHGNEKKLSAAHGGSAARERVVAVQVAMAHTKDLPIWLDGLGTVTAAQQITVRAQVDGRLDTISFVEGQAVKQGDVLAQIDPRPFEIALAQAEGALVRDRAQRDTSQWNAERYKTLREENLVANQTVEQYIGEVRQFTGSMAIDRAQIDAAKLQLDYAQIKSPIDGIAGLRQVDAGNVIHQTDPNGLVVITTIDPIAVIFTVPQDVLGDVSTALARGDVPVEVYSRDGATRLGTGKLAVLDNQVNAATSTLRLKALVPNPQHRLWPNAFVKARMLVQTRTRATVVPLVAIQNGPQGTYVLVVGADHVAQQRPVVVGVTSGNEVAIDRGLAPGEQVVVEGQDQVRPGTKVAVSVANAS